VRVQSPQGAPNGRDAAGSRQGRNAELNGKPTPAPRKPLALGCAARHASERLIHELLRSPNWTGHHTTNVAQWGFESLPERHFGPPAETDRRLLIASRLVEFQRGPPDTPAARWTERSPPKAEMRVRSSPGVPNARLMQLVDMPGSKIGFSRFEPEVAHQLKRPTGCPIGPPRNRFRHPRIAGAEREHPTMPSRASRRSRPLLWLTQPGDG
jgi:hypothetical protein